MFGLYDIRISSQSHRDPRRPSQIDSCCYWISWLCTAENIAISSKGLHLFSLNGPFRIVFVCVCVCLLNLFHLSTIFVRWNKVRDFLAHRLVLNKLQYRVHQPKNYVFSSIHSHSIIITYCAWTISFNFLDWCMSYLPFDRPSFMRNSIAADRTSEEGLKIKINELQQFC